MAVIPNTNAMFAIFDPITLLIAMAGDPSKAACKLTNNSGTEVANETTVIPITILEMFNLKERPMEERTKNSPPKTNNIRPIIIYATLIKYLFAKIV